MAAAATTLRIRSGDLFLAAREHSPAGPGRPTVVLVHGYPDQQDVWDVLLSRLPLDAWHVVTYDVRGAGSSDVPVHLDGYRTERLVDDLVAVLDATSGDEAVHLVGHDWGSVQLWDAVAAEATDPRLRGRIASFTSVSGPSLDHSGWIARHARGRRLGLLRQLLHSWYVYLFHIPRLPDLVWHRAHRRLARLVEAREGLPRGHWGDELGPNAANGLNLYHANFGRRIRRTTPFRTDVPVLVVHPERDNYLTGVLLEDLDVPCSNARLESVDAGHWAIVTHADVLARLVREHVENH